MSCPSTVDEVLFRESIEEWRRRALPRRGLFRGGRLVDRTGGHAGEHQALVAGRDLVAPSYQGRRGHPVGIARRFREDLLAFDGDRGAGPLLKRHAETLTLIQCEGPGILLDIDTPNDLRSLGKA